MVMCGIVGIIKSKSFNDPTILKELIYVSALRGKHSTGLMYKEGDECFTYKKAMEAADFLNLIPVNSILGGINRYDFIFCHNRHATIGVKTTLNAHPYEIDGLVGMHNGTVKNSIMVVNGFPSTDSYSLLMSIKDNYHKTLSTMNGTAALVWYNENKLFMYRSGRPLSYAESSEGSIYLASESHMLDLVLSRNDVKYTLCDLKEETLYIMDFATGKSSQEKIVREVETKSTSLVSGCIIWEPDYATDLALYGRTDLGTPVVWYKKNIRPEDIGMTIKMVKWKEYPISEKDYKYLPSLFFGKKTKLICITNAE